MNKSTVRLTQFSHGAGCGCKIAPNVLDEILRSNIEMPDEEKLLVGNHSKDDAAVYSLGNGMALISTTDFFMPIVDDPYSFGRIAAANAISDVYAMGGKPLLAIAILGWPVNQLAPEIARDVVEGGRATCREAGIPLAGGHSIDSPEPIFGLAVNGLVSIENIKTNQGAKPGDLLFISKALGVGILTTAEKKKILKPEHQGLAAKQMLELNRVGETLGKLSAVHSITDVTGFGLFGHLTEMMEGSDCSASLQFERIRPIVSDWEEYIAAGAVPGGTHRNWNSYGEKIGPVSENVKLLLSDPQTSGGLLISVAPDSVTELQQIFREHNLDDFLEPIGEVVPVGTHRIIVK